jgi:hypothetical protein
MADKSKMKCNVPRREVQGGKKFVVKACQGGKEKIVRFGDANMSIKKDQPSRKKSYCARSGGLRGSQINYLLTIGAVRLGTANVY